jgi:asparagine synthase (glutamine-hydrolysing)
MCGICGIVDPKRRLAPIGAMNRIQRHRGPDDEGFLFIDTRTGVCRAGGGDDTGADGAWPHYKAIPLDKFDVALGSRRLAVLDLSPVGRMPMSYNNGSLWITYNGEVYNHSELRVALQGLGYSFWTATDTEVILAAYAEWGEACVARFNGMFAFAIWDARRRRLFCSRDRLGVKPFYYAWDGSTFVFASEIKAILLHPAVSRAPHEGAIFDYLVLGVCDHTDRTFFEKVRALPAGCSLTLDPGDSTIEIRRWWHVEVNPAIGGSPGQDQTRICDEFRGLLEDAIRLRLRSDVPVGTCLSGGLDSSAIVCLANRLLCDEQVIPRRLVGDHQKTFTARNVEIDIDEYEYSQLVVEQTGAEQHSVFPDGSRLWDEIEAFAWHMDEPFSSTSQYAQWNVMRLARDQGVTVLLDGQGGDELLAGYQSYLPLYVTQIAQQASVFAAIRAAWQVCRVGGASTLEALYADYSARVPFRLRQVMHAVRPPRIAPGNAGSGATDRDLVPEFVRRHADRLWRPAAMDGLGLAGVLRRDMVSTNLPMLLRYEDRNSMAFSIEARVPFLDYRLVEFTCSLPLDYRIRHGWSKWILRESLRDVLPPAVCWRRSKLGYPVPERKWLAQGGRYIRALLRRHERGRLSDFVRAEVMDELVRMPDGVLASVPGVWRFTNLALWFDLFVDGSRAPNGVDLSSSQARDGIRPLSRLPRAAHA